MICRSKRSFVCQLGLLTWGLALLLSACSGDDAAEEVTFDFARMLPLAQVQVETAKIDFGDPEAAAFLGSSWTEGDQEKTFLWAKGERSEVRFRVHRKRALTLRARARAFSFPGAPEQRVKVSVNGVEAATLTLGDSFAEQVIEVPEEAVEDGENVLVLEHSYSRSPAAAGLPSNDQRPLAAAWDYLLIDGAAVHQGDPQVRQDEDGTPTLILPSSVRLDYYLRLFDDSELHFDRLTPRGSLAAGAPAPKLGVEVLTGSGQRHWHELDVTGPEARLYLRLFGSGIVRLSFQVVSGPGAGDSVTGLALGRPVLVRDQQPVTAPTQPEASTASRPNVLIYVIDTLRADHLGCYGYGRPTSPRIDAFAAEATLFTRAIAQTAWTRPAIASILTGLRPRVHGAVEREDALSGTVPTLGSLLTAAGYRTAGFTTNGNVAPGFGFARGFDLYEHLEEDQSFEIHRQSDDVNRAALVWLDENRGDEPFFLFLHTVDPHAPYTPRQPFRDRLARREIDPEIGHIDRVNGLGSLPVAEQRALRDDLVDLYDAEIAFNDHHFGELLDALEERGLSGSTLIILVADHGEEFLDHDHWQHGRTLYQEQIHIPLIVRFPGGLHAGRRVGAMARQIDLLPTVLHAAGVEVPDSVQGRPLQELLAVDPGSFVAQPVFSHLRLDGYDQDAVIAERWKLIRYHGRTSQEISRQLFDLGIDPEEQENLAEDSPVELAYTRGLLDQIVLFGPASLTPGEAEISDELRERLEALGYLTPRSEP